VFSLVNTLLLRPLPHPHPERLVEISRATGDDRALLISLPSFTDYRARSSSFDGMAAYLTPPQTLAEDGATPERTFGMIVSEDFFPLLDARPLLGRTFERGEHQEGRNRVVVLSAGLWQRRFGGDPAVLGRKLRLDEQTLTVVGVMPASFNPPLGPWGHVDLWWPMVVPPQLPPQARHNNWLSVVARLKPGVPLVRAQEELSRIAGELDREHHTGSGVAVRPLQAAAVGGTEARVAWLTLALSVLVLLIACTNLAGVQLARLAARSQEYALRIALGASRARLVRQTFAESVLLSLAGGALGVVLAAWSCALLGARMTVGQQAAAVSVPIDGRVLVFALLMSLVTAAAVGVLPAFLVSGRTLSQSLRRGGRGATDRAQPALRQGLVVVEMALALALLAAGGLFLRGLERFAARDLGWQSEGVLSGFINFPVARYPNAPERNAFFDRLQPRLEAIPGLTRATLSNHIPRGALGSGVIETFQVEGLPPPPPGQAPPRSRNHVAAGYFETLGITLREGRTFRSSDRLDAPPVAIINETMARRFWPGASPIGKRIGDAVGAPHWTTIVGVVSDVHYLTQLSRPATRYQVYYPLHQRSGGALAMTLRGPRPDLLAAELRRAVADLDPTLAVHGIRTSTENLSRGLANFAVLGWIVSALAVLGLLLSGLGVYGLFSGWVVQRTREIGVRMALGAQSPEVLRLVLGKGLRLAMLGGLLGVAGGLLVVTVLRTLMSELPLRDPLVLVAVALLLIAVALFACWLPARRAARLDPMVALRAE
jgi:predicted permease